MVNEDMVGEKKMKRLKKKKNLIAVTVDQGVVICCKVYGVTPNP